MKCYEEHKVDELAVIVVNSESPITEELEAGMQFMIMNLCPTVESCIICQPTADELENVAKIIEEDTGILVDNALSGVRIFIMDIKEHITGFNYATPAMWHDIAEEIIVNDKYEHFVLEEEGRLH